MYLRHLQVVDFRSWPQADLEFEPGCTVLLGQNGRGKTNLLEAIGYLSSLSSHRVANDAPLIRHGCERALVRASVVNEDRELTIELEITAGKANRARVNRGAVSRSRDILGILRTVLFSPEDLSLVRGDPSERRKFLDELLVARSPRYAGVRADYEKVLKQRNALLKAVGKRATGRERDPHALSTLDVWDKHLAEVGAQLLAGRLNLVADLAPYASAAYAGVAPDSQPISMSYRSTLFSELPEGYGHPDGERAQVDVLVKVLTQALEQSRKAELDRGISLVGPHRDELNLMLGESLAKGYASHGESWSFALALRLGSYELLRGEGTEPVLLLDDVFAELDKRRRTKLAEVAASSEQVLVTAAVEEDVPDELIGAQFMVADGQVVKR